MIPHDVMDTNFKRAMQAAPHPNKWLIPSYSVEDCPEYDEDFLDGFRGARYPSSSMAEHMTLITTLRSMFLRDRCIFSLVSVVDLRDVITQNQPLHKGVPFISTENVIRNSKFHMKPGDFPLTIQNKLTVMTGEMSERFIQDGPSCHRAYLCTIMDHVESNTYSSTRVTYFLEKDCFVPLDCDLLPFQHRMHLLQGCHLTWLEKQLHISTYQYCTLMNAYSKDNTANREHSHQVVTKCYEVLGKKYAHRQWDVYVGSTYQFRHPILDSTQAMYQKMQIVYSTHIDVVDSEDVGMNFLEHQKWTKLYNRDPFLDGPSKSRCKVAIDRSLGRYIKSIQGSFFIDCFQEAAIKYHASIPDLNEQSNIIALPYTDWQTN